jgi:phage baseplate assembly protein W
MEPTGDRKMARFFGCKIEELFELEDADRLEM